MRIADLQPASPILFVTDGSLIDLPITELQHAPWSHSAIVAGRDPATGRVLIIECGWVDQPNWMDRQGRHGVTATWADERFTPAELARAFVLPPFVDVDDTERICLLTAASLDDSSGIDYSEEDLIRMGLHLIDPAIPPAHETPVDGFICSVYVAWRLSISVPRLFSGNPDHATPAVLAGLDKAMPGVWRPLEKLVA